MIELQTELVTFFHRITILYEIMTNKTIATLTLVFERSILNNE